MIQNRQQVCPQCRRYRWIPLALAPYCTDSCKREATGVICCVCRKPWLPTSPGISYRSSDGRWWCTSPADCARRLARSKARQKQLLDQAIALLASMFPEVVRHA